MRKSNSQQKGTDFDFDFWLPQLKEEVDVAVVVVALQSLSVSEVSQTFYLFRSLYVPQHTSVGGIHDVDDVWFISWRYR